MKPKIIFATIAGLIFICAVAASAMSSANFKITSSVMSGGGGSMSSSSFASHTILGQPSPIAEQGIIPISTNYDLYPGFMYTLATGSFCPWDLSSPMDGDVDGLDLYQYLYDGIDNTLYLEDFSGEFGRNDCF